MKSIIHSWAQSVALMLILVLQIAALLTPTTAQKETAVRFESAVLFGTTGEFGSVFMLDDGNLYAVEDEYTEESGSRFLLVLDTNNTDDPTDDAVLEVWAAPHGIQ